MIRLSQFHTLRKQGKRSREDLALTLVGKRDKRISSLRENILPYELARFHNDRLISRSRFDPKSVFTVDTRTFSKQRSELELSSRRLLYARAIRCDVSNDTHAGSQDEMISPSRRSRLKSTGLRRELSREK